MVKVSIIIPNFNSIEFIKETLDSVYNQTHKNIEVIVVDDSSSDNSFEYIFNLKKPNLILVKNPKKGACAARNYGFELSTGDYIQYLDADDLLSANKIEEQLELAGNHGGRYIYSCGYVRFNKNIYEQVWQRQYIDKDYDDPKLWLLDSWMGKGMGTVHSWLISRDLINLAGPWNEDLLLNQDGEFISRVLFNAQGVRFSENAQVYYRSGILNSTSQNLEFSESKATSLLKSYMSYKESSIKYNSLDLLKIGLGQNFLSFIYQHSARFPELIDKAKKEFYSLGFKKMWPVGGNNFRRIARLIGFDNALRIKRLL